MYTLAIILIGMAIGAMVLPTLSFFVSRVQRRMNYGTPVHFDGQEIGHVVVCRWDGTKRYFYVNHMGDLVRERGYYHYEEAEDACRKAHVEQLTLPRPKQTSFARAI